MKKINQWRPSYLVEWSCTNKKFKLMRTLIFGQMVCTKERINERGSYNLVEWPCTNKRNKSLKTLTLVEWLCTKERINERGPYILVEWSCANKRHKSVGTLYSGRMVVHIASAKITECEASISPYSFLWATARLFSL